MASVTNSTHHRAARASSVEPTTKHSLPWTAIWMMHHWSSAHTHWTTSHHPTRAHGSTMALESWIIPAVWPGSTGTRSSTLHLHVVIHRIAITAILSWTERSRSRPRVTPAPAPASTHAPTSAARTGCGSASTPTPAAAGAPAPTPAVRSAAAARWTSASSWTPRSSFSSSGSLILSCF